MSHNFLNNTDVKGQGLIEKTKTYLIGKYNQSRKMFSYSTSFGQILLTIQNHNKIILAYIKDSILEMSFKTARRSQSIFGMAQLQGHNASRGTGSTGVIRLSPKKDVFTSEFPNKLFLTNFSKIICRNDSTLYYVSLGKEFIEIDTRSPSDIEFSVNQGEMRVESFVGDGNDNQSYNIVENRENIDMNHIIVEVNGKRYTNVNSFQEFIYGGKNCIIRTGLTSGIDIIFGKSVYNEVPQEGSTIQVFYPIVSGEKGNKNSGVFEFIDPLFSPDGKEFQVSSLYDLTVTQPFILGSNAENPEITKIIAPNINRNRIVHDRKSVQYFFEKTNLFSKVKVFNDNDASVMDTFLYPKIENISSTGKDIFTISESDILLDQNTKDRLLDWVNKHRSENIDVRLRNPKIKKYSMEIILSIRSEIQNSLDFQEIKNKVRNDIAKNLSKFSKTNFIAKSDIIKYIDKENIDSVNVSFVTETKEMLDDMGDILVQKTELALPMTPFVSLDGDEIQESISIEIKVI